MASKSLIYQSIFLFILNLIHTAYLLPAIPTEAPFEAAFQG